MSKGRTVAPRLGQAATKPTDEDVRIDVSVDCAHDLGSGSSGRSSRGRRRGGSRVKPSKCLVREYLERRHPVGG